MGMLRDSVHVDAPPERVWDWLLKLADHYTDWHQDHVSAVWNRGEPNRVGSRLKVVEVLGGRREALEMEVTAVDPPHRLGYRVRGPHSMLLPGGAFEVTRDDGGATFTATVSYRFGAVIEQLFPRRTAALRAHMRQEGENLKRLIEAGG